MKKILIVEDDWLIQLTYKSLLAKEYDVSVCEDSIEFYSGLEKDTYDMFIIDLALNSEKSGIDLIEELRKIDKYKNSPILVVSAFVFKKDQNNALNAGATKFIPKPFDNKMLLEVIKNILNS